MNILFSITDKIGFYVKYRNDSKHQFAMKKLFFENLKDSKAFIDYSKNMKDVYENIDV